MTPRVSTFRLRPPGVPARAYHVLGPHFVSLNEAGLVAEGIIVAIEEDSAEVDWRHVLSLWGALHGWSQA